jgi:hypothetical protein
MNRAIRLQIPAAKYLICCSLTACLLAKKTSILESWSPPPLPVLFFPITVVMIVSTALVKELLGLRDKVGAVARELIYSRLSANEAGTRTEWIQVKSGKEVRRP